jgi:3-phosphoglycerate kinase
MHNEKKYSYKSLLSEFNLKNKKILLRADLNVPLNNEKILDDYRLLATLLLISF